MFKYDTKRSCDKCEALTRQRDVLLQFARAVKWAKSEHHIRGGHHCDYGRIVQSLHDKAVDLIARIEKETRDGE